MNNKWIVCLALALTGCGGSGLGGTWKGEAAGWSMTVVLEEATEQSGTSYLTGTVSSNKSACFTNGTAAATLVNGKSAQILSTASGTASATPTSTSGTLHFCSSERTEVSTTGCQQRREAPPGSGGASRLHCGQGGS